MGTPTESGVMIAGRYRHHTCLDSFIAEYNHINYCEIGILPDGSVLELVCTSHQEMLFHVAYGKFVWELEDAERFDIEKEMGGMDFLEFLCSKTGCCTVWYYTMAIPRQGITDAQFLTIRKLYEAEKIDINMKSKDVLPNNVGYHKVANRR